MRFCGLVGVVEAVSLCNRPDAADSGSFPPL